MTSDDAPAGTRELRTDRLLLRPFRPEDAARDVADAQAYRDDPEFARYLPHVPQPSTRADAEAFVALNMGEPWATSPTFAVVLDGRLIGTVSFEVDPAARSAMLGYAVGRSWWGRGIATEAARAAVAWAAEAYALVRVWASVDARNVGSRRVLEKLGLLEEGRTAGGTGRDGETTESVVYGLDLAG